jgi:hypothetical protein
MKLPPTQLSINNQPSKIWEIPRPFSIKLVVFGVLCFAALNLLRFIRTIMEWDFLKGLIQISPLYLLLSGLIWGVVGILLAYQTWRGWGKAPVFLFLVAILYMLYDWLDRLFLSQNQFINWRFILVADILVLGMLLYIYTRKNVKVFFGGNHE